MLYCYTLLLSLVFGSFGALGAFGSFGAFGAFGSFKVLGVLVPVEDCFLVSCTVSVVADDVVEDTDDDVTISPIELEFTAVFEGNVYDFL